MSLLSSDETTFVYEVDDEDEYTVAEWHYKRNPFRKLLGWSPKLIDVELESNRGYNDGDEEIRYNIRNRNVGKNCKYSYDINRVKNGDTPDAKGLVDLHPHGELSKEATVRNGKKVFNSEIKNIDSDEEPVEVIVESEITDGSNVRPLHSGGAVIEEGEVKYQLSGHDDAWTDINSYVSEVMQYFDLDEDELTPEEGLASEELEANTLVEDTWRDFRSALGGAAERVSEGVGNSLSTISRDARTYWIRMVTDDVIEAYNLERDEFLEFIEESNGALVEDIEYSNRHHPIEKKSRTAETFETVTSDPELRLMPENVEVVKKEEVDGVEYHGKVFFDTDIGELPSGDTDWTTSDEPDIEIRVKAPEDYEFPSLEGRDESEEDLEAALAKLES